jgi:hypothetical protein
MADYGDFSLQFSADFVEQLDQKELKEIIAAIEADGDGIDDIAMDVTSAENETKQQRLINSLTEHPMTSVTLAIHNNNNNSVGTGTVNFEAPEGYKPKFKKLSEEDLKSTEINQYYEATKRNTKWGIGVFNGKFFNFVLNFVCLFLNVCGC